MHKNHYPLKFFNSGRRRLFLFLLLALIHLLPQEAAGATLVTIGDLKYDIDEANSQATVVGMGEGISAINNLVIPDLIYYNGANYPITSIGRKAFTQNTSLTGSLTIGNSVKTIGYEAFSYCDGLTGSLIIGNSVDNIEYRAFYDSKFTGALVIGNSVQTIGGGAFGYCGFTGSLTIPQSVQSIGDGAFANCSGFTGLLILPNSVQSIGDHGFDGCSGFSGDLIIPSSLTKIAAGSFYNCRGFNGQLIIPNSVQTIEEAAFSYCSGFTGDLVIPNSVKRIELAAFQKCSGFNGNLVIGNAVQYIGEHAFFQCTGFSGDLTIPSSVHTIEKTSFYHCSGFTGNLSIPNSVQKIGESAFYRCTGFTGDLVIPNSIQTIEMAVFCGCGFNGNLTISNSVRTICSNAFNGCAFTGELRIPASVQTIERGAFLSCSGFSGTLMIGDSVETIGSMAFYSCPGIESISLPISLKTIGGWAFYNCDNLKTVRSEAVTPPLIASEDMAFDETTHQNAKLIVPNDGLEQYKTAYDWKEFKYIQESQVDAESITLNRTEATLKATETLDLVATVLPETTTDKSVTWTSSNEAVATVDSNGKVIAVAVGNATITAICGDVSAECVVTVIARETPPISVERSDELVVLADGAQTTMWVKIEGGNPDGLTYEWTLDGVAVGSAESLTVTGRSNSGEMSEVTYALRVRDTMDGALIFDETYDFTVQTWPRPGQTDATDVSATQIREGNTLRVEANAPAGGYEDWRYEWTLAGAKVSDALGFDYITKMAAGTEKATEKLRFDFRGANYGPDGAIWGETAAQTADVTVYRRPLTPVQLLRKGNGTTHTLVIMAGIGDDEIGRRGYNFVYGYTAADGADKILARTSRRYCQIERAVFDNAGMEKWCYAEWTYADGSTVSSGKRYLDGKADESFDASRFSGSRQSGVQGVDTGNISIKMDAEGVTLAGAPASTMRIDLIGIDGVRVFTTEIDAATYGTVRIDATVVAPGMYLLRIADGETQTVKKIAIK